MSCSCFGASVKRENDDSHVSGEFEGRVLGNIKAFSYNELRTATDNFHQRNKIGRGGFGTVYKGILINGIEVAVKTLSAESKQGVREFLTEIDIISNVRHPNLVQLIGCCVQGTNRILVYEFLVNKSLDTVLLAHMATGSKGKSTMLDWDKRSAICKDVARAIAYLHEEVVPPIVHRDIKASNILLDKDFKPKIGDFGLAKLFPDNITHISTRIVGTTGYLAPEYVLGGQLTKKADVYSFGVLMLEILSAKYSGKPTLGTGMQKLLLEWAWQLYEEGQLLEMVDPELEGFPEEEVIRYIKIAFFCTQGTASRRPTMSQVVDMLSRNTRLNEKELLPPGFSQDTGGRSSSRNKSSDTPTSTQMSSVPVSITQITPR
ncbi:cold-responsive protein kinase 1-like isoform X1 [Apium graveolens]|uniref:cold-responsive protein kinase 1-like isoform X1 n=1 Tax=Apium graveolens TaxID=4045 RepID=UPI003D79CD14